MCRAIVGGAGGGEAGGGGATAAERGAKAQQQAQALGLMGCQPQLHARADNQMAERTIPHVFFCYSIMAGGLIIVCCLLSKT